LELEGFFKQKLFVEQNRRNTKIYKIKKINNVMKSKSRASDPIHLITGVLLILGGLLYIFSFGSWGLVIASIGLLIEAMKQLI